MPKPIDLNVAIRAIVAEEVEAALAPHREALERIEAFLGVGAPTRRRARQPGAPAEELPRRTAPLRSSERGDASRFQRGQRVRIKVGRGSDLGTVQDLDLRTNSVLVKRDKGGDVVKRPASRVELAEPAERPE